MSHNKAEDLGNPIPEVSHPVSVSLPTWELCVANQEGEAWVLEKLVYGYPRYYFHPTIVKYRKKVLETYGDKPTPLEVLPFPSLRCAVECAEFIKRETDQKDIEIYIKCLDQYGQLDEQNARIFNVIFPADQFPTAKLYWSMTGNTVSSRMVEHYFTSFGQKENLQSTRTVEKLGQTTSDMEKIMGRICDLIKVAGSESKESIQIPLSPSDVYLYPTGMSAVYNAHQLLLRISGGRKKSVCFGFPFVDSLKILKTFGPGVEFLGLGDDSSLDQLEQDLRSKAIDPVALWCETPSNPLLKMADLKRLKKLADEFDFAVVLDDTLGNFCNVYVLPYADIVVTSLTKLFSGACDVMGGSLVLNPSSKYHSNLQTNMNYECLLFDDDAAVLELNSRDFKARSDQINRTTLEVVELLRSNPLVKTIHYPSVLPSKAYYDEVKTSSGGYGGLMTVEFYNDKHARIFYDSLQVRKGPLLGTNFTLACPYTVLAHYKELDDVKKWGIRSSMVRVSIGLESVVDLKQAFQASLDALQHFVDSEKS